ncbi:uncharacterized protein RCC_00995 [Ramularia collo-cygni]|uniref:AAA+ ATPase domain-containing protein n=1 Tax=Ramularia collo-cygni TaxID=112498 RepID=A0A2D3UVQ9_9PEZI|nr:uncharacterized protein RCC_00995 [Ramularia collo-cygni]CZT15096.1 uncharacterized protein RCC_00995 [Ramularia collo-cygni]
MASREASTSTHTVGNGANHVLTSSEVSTSKSGAATPITGSLERPVLHKAPESQLSGVKPSVSINGTTDKHGATQSPTAKHVSAQVPNTNPDEYVGRLERRLQIVEEELQTLRNYKSTSDTSAGEVEKASDSLTEKKPEVKDDKPDSATAKDFDDLFGRVLAEETETKGDKKMIMDREQELKIEQMNYLQFRKVKSEMGVCKGSVLVSVTATKGSIGCGELVPESEDQSTEVPYRLAINSHCLLELLGNITETTMSSKNVHCRPFKFLVSNEKLIKDKLASLNAECEALKEEKAAVADSTTQTGEDSSAATEATAIENTTTEVTSIKTTSNEGTSAETTSTDVVSVKKTESDAATPPATVEENENVKKLRTRDHLKLLVAFIDEHISDISQLRVDLDDAKLDELSFEDLWHLFRPGQLVLQDNNQLKNARKAFRVLHVTGGRPMIDMDGKKDAWNDLDHDGVLSQSELKRTKLARRAYGVAKMTPLIIDVAYVDFDGRYLGPRSTRIPILAYDGKRSIRSLEIYPAHYAVDRSVAESELLARGKLFAKYAHVHHRDYEGRSLRDERLNTWLEDDKRGDDEVSGQCIIDQAHILDSHLSFKADYIAKPTDQDGREITWFAECGVKDCRACSDMYVDDGIDRKYRDVFMESDAGKHLLDVRDHATFVENTDGKNDDLYMLLPLRLYGYALTERKWHALNVNNFCERQADNSFDDLVLPEENKTLLRALVKNHMGLNTGENLPDNLPRRRASMAPPSLDIIRGKGRGLIILLHGVPGVGKTSTAESIAAQLDRPLFPITCGDLGTTAIEVEDALEDYFRLATKWKCVLLLDEADVFLAQRRGGDFKRNGLVSVFLRVLEYYAGILILTTNRVGEFDEAFRSRIHISLYYPPLDRTSTEKIWKLNLDRIETSPEFDLDIRRKDIMDFCKKHWETNQDFPGRLWNGRQIKNGFHTAIALANWDFWDNKGHEKREKPLLTAKQFEYVAKTSSAFDDYLDEVHHSSNLGAHSEWVATHKLRKDDYEPSPSGGKRMSLPHRNSGSNPSRRTTARGQPPSTPRNGSSRVLTTMSLEPQEMMETDAEIKRLKTKLKNLDKAKISQEKRDDMKFDILDRLESLGVVEGDGGEETNADIHEDGEKAPWG